MTGPELALEGPVKNGWHKRFELGGCLALKMGKSFKTPLDVV
jgi:hypothetical protein